ncbi:MAG: MtaA/CmuA family methyltransferase [Methanomassiliicoccus sp.]|nr:MtaA/CmuA family methyltransferase [Methanomassiliicoccus sp.]
MTPKERFLAALSRKQLDRPAVGCVTQSVTVDQMDAVGVHWPEAHTDARMMATLGAAGAKVFGFENARIPFCLTVEAEALGATVDLGKVDRTPMVKKHPFESDADPVFDKDFMHKGRAKTVIEATKILKKEVGHELPIVVGTTGPVTIAGHMIGTETLLLMMITEPETVHKFCKVAAAMEKEYQKALVAAGADVIAMSDPSASTDMMSAEMFDEFAKPYIKETWIGAEGAKKILHICGNTTVLLDHMIDTGADGLSIEEKVNPFEAVKIVDNRAALVGNMGVVRPLLQGTPEECREHALQIKEAGFNIVAPGCGLAARVPKANIEAMVKAIKG